MIWFNYLFLIYLRWEDSIMNNNYDLNNENRIGDEGNNVFVGSVNNDLVNNSNNTHNNLDNYNQTLQNSLGSNGNSENIVYNSSTINSDGNLKNNNKKNKIGFIVAMIVIAVVLLTLGAKILIPIVATKQINSTISTAKLNSIIDEYRIIEKNVKTFVYIEQTATCDSECYKLYDYNEKNFDIKVTDKDTYYQIELKAIGETYKGANLDSDKCKNLSNAVCKGNEITGKVYKISE